ncbi:MAG: endonuclease I family protein [Candidatus Sericytochromatia bacterium]
MRFQALLFSLTLSSLLGACQSVPQARPVTVQSVRAGDWYSRLTPELQRYYAPARGLQGEALLQALHGIVQQARVLEYGDATASLYTYIEQIQQGKTTLVRDVYSHLLIAGDGPSGHKYKELGDANGDGKKGDGINCEHTWPQSFFDKQGAMRTDLHHLFPTLSTPNSQRGSLPYGLASEGRVTYATASGSKAISRPQGGPVFEPNTPHKGNAARALLYFYLRYYDQPIRQSEYRAGDFFVQRLPLFRNWLALDPIDAQEQLRHQRVFERQGNRNPFIDIPELLDLIGVETLQRFESRLSGGA